MKQLCIILLIVLTWQTKVICQESSCVITSYRRVYYLQNDTIRILHQLHTSDGGQLLVGKTSPAGFNKSDGLIIKTDDSANILWSKRISDTQPLGSLNFNNAIESADGSYIIGGYTILQTGNSVLSYYLARCDLTGNILWQQEYPVNNGLGQWENINLTGLAEGMDRAIYITGALTGVVSQQAATQFALIIKTDLAGQLKFSKLYYENSVDLNTFIGIFPSPGSLLLWGYCNDDHNTQADGRRIYWMRLDENDASLQAGQATCFTPFIQSASSYTINPHLLKAFKTDNGYSIAGLLAENTAAKRAIVNFLFDHNLVLKQSWMLPQITGIIAANAGDFSVANDGSLLLAQRSNTQNTQIYLSRYGSNGALFSQRQIDGFGAGTGVNTVNGGIRIGIQNNGILFSNNYMRNLVPVCEFLDLSNNIADSLCFGKQTKYGSPQNFQTYPLPTTLFNTFEGIVGIQSGSLTATEVTIKSEAICSAQSNCSSLFLTGNDTVCILGQPAYYTARRNQSCSMPVKWIFDSAQCANTTVLTDSTISITWKTTVAGKQITKLIATLDNCSGISDTMPILLIPFLKPFQPDTMLCTGDSIKLSPGDWFKSYLWQDGSTDSVLVARKPGLYTVTYQTFCGRTITDSVHINEVNIVLLANNAQSVCKGDSFILQAKSGFSNYQWTPDYYKQSIAENAVIVFPPSDTTYIVSAIIKPGCRIYDSISITIVGPAEIKIIKETQICEEAVLSVHSSADLFQTFWLGPSGTQTGNKIKVTKSGLYTLSVTDLNGCRTKDSIILMLDPCTEQINFPNAFTPNQDGRNDVFRPIVKGNLIEYEMNVYSSWGQRVFYSHVPSEGWDGKISGQLQQNSSFVWVCKYRFQGEQPVIKKGTVTLIH